MKKLIGILSFICLSCFVFCNEIEFEGVKIRYDFPAENYRLVENNTIGTTYVRTYKLKSIKSVKYNIAIIPNLSIIIEKMPVIKDDKQYMLDMINFYSKIRGYKKFPSRDYLILEKPNYSIDYYFEYIDQKGYEHSVYLLTKVIQNIGIRIIFDSTSDVFDLENEILEEFVKSLKLESE